MKQGVWVGVYLMFPQSPQDLAEVPSPLTFSSSLVGMHPTSLLCLQILNPQGWNWGGKQFLALLHKDRAEIFAHNLTMSQKVIYKMSIINNC